MSRDTVYAAVFLVGIVLATAAHIWATSQRGYEAIGGEILIAMAPVWVWIAESVYGCGRGDK